MVRPKKHLGQHFLKDLNVAEKIARGLSGKGYEEVLEIGPGTGVLTQFLLKSDKTVYLCEIDTESVAYLKEHYSEVAPRLFEEDFLKMNLQKITDKPLALAGNFPYNISSQILFKVYDHKDQFVEVVGMFQKEVAKRVASPPGSKEYGILSVLLQAFFDIEYLFTVPPGVFLPPPKVDSGVIRLRRNGVSELGCDPRFFTQVVKAAFGKRRKTLRNALKQITPEGVTEFPFMDKRAEQLEVADFVAITQALSIS
ncbi:16S rRNA (adenine(1518)-N(6)/adenine(1519)-N(6))-dimethyltransferase RsmA [bacterium SCSIO 12741]|nr:16S rRNA (adenine(1518)-N(6)/adenine(1519)-N(6))-dimethyltransferase RsmA [bacterium SCSIO 12741]